jgi:hypothetical protein
MAEVPYFLEFPTNAKCRNPVLMLDRTQLADIIANVTSHQLLLETTLRSTAGLAPHHK